MRISGLLSSDDAATVRTTLDPLAAPQPDQDGQRDPRQPDQRMADALVELCRRHLSHADLPTNHGHAVHLLLLANLTTLIPTLLTSNGNGDWDTPGDISADADHQPTHASQTGARGDPPADHEPNETSHTDTAGPQRWIQDTWARRFGIAPAELTWGGPISTPALRRLTCDAAVTPILLDPHGIPLRVGRTERTVTPGIFTALVTRDRGCTFPGCTRPPAWCHAHHIQHWADGGPTDLNNLVLLCTHHHRTIHHAGWDIQLAADGHPEFLPPPWIDPQRHPRRNTPPRHDHQPPPRHNTQRPPPQPG